MERKTFIVEEFDRNRLLNNLPKFLCRFRSGILLNSNGYPEHPAVLNKGKSYPWLAAASNAEIITSNEESALVKLQQAVDRHRDWLFGHLAYNLKTESPAIFPKHTESIGFPEMHFFQPEWLFMETDGKLHVEYPSNLTRDEAERTLDQLNRAVSARYKKKTKVSFTPRQTKEEYLKTVHRIKDHIQRGDIYEINYCQEFYCEKCIVDPPDLFNRLMKSSPTPFSAFYKCSDKYLICASPERFLTGRNNRLYSQPIKGTAPRGSTYENDRAIVEKLRNDTKEIAENVMIVDLVRNDLSVTAAKGSVKVDELCGIYSFPQVHQMISTISSELKNGCSPVDAVKAAFPMGSMTGCPKLRAMEIIREYEPFNRGLFSGSVGYFDPSGNFDLNVVIRSLYYNERSQYLSYKTGGAVTIHSVPEKEYDECLLKAKGIVRIFDS